MNKNEALLILANKILDTRLKPVLDKCMTMPKVIKYREELDNNSYMEWLAKDKITCMKGSK